MSHDTRPLNTNPNDVDPRTMKIHMIVRWALVLVVLALTVPFALLLPVVVGDPCAGGLLPQDCVNKDLLWHKEMQNGTELLLALLAIGVNEYLMQTKKPKSKANAGGI